MTESPLPSPSGEQPKASTYDEKPSFNYDLDLFLLTKQYLDTKNHHGLALLARQKGIPPFLRFKVWPILLKYHPFVLNPFIQPDTDIKDDNKNNAINSNNETHENTKKLNDTNDDSQPRGAFDSNNINSSSSNSSNSSSSNSSSKNELEEIRQKIKKDLRKYIQRLKYSSSILNISEVEHEMFNILESSVLKFTLKWGKIIKYDPSLTWIALNLAEWFPPIPKSAWVLRGRDSSSPDNALIINIFDDYSNYIDNISDLQTYLHELVEDERISSMSFHDVYERLVLVLLHSPEQKKKNSGSSKDHSFLPPKKINKSVLPINGGTIEERVSFFIYCLRKLLPELSQFFHEEQILNKFGSSDDEWLIWWLKFGGAKVWSKYDRGRIWDLLLGWRLKNPKKNTLYYVEKLDNIDKKSLAKLGPDIFWSLSNDESYGASKPNNDMRRNSFKDLVEELNNDLLLSKLDTKTDSSTLSSRRASEASSTTSAVSQSTASSQTTIGDVAVPFSKLDAHIELIFISLALLKSKENLLVELDQHEIRQLLSRLPSKSYKYKQKKQFVKSSSDKSSSSTSSASSSSSSSPRVAALSPSLPANDNTYNIIISNDSQHNHKVDFMDNIINEAGELWRKWLWSEMIEDS
ncbi:hypothetical protein G9P44_002522 [Scheffersomyces stipitis]|nr:hypothetical protein G9P44_002522 [Scheffersomyces stipitis]